MRVLCTLFFDTHFTPVSLTTPLLSTGACRFFSPGGGRMPVPFGFHNNSSSGKVENIDYLRCSSAWLISKHPADVLFKKSSGHVRHTRCPHTLKTFLKKCCALFEPGLMPKIVYLPVPQTVGQNENRIHIASSVQPGATGNALNVE